ncbi:MAG: sialidase family protein [Thermomicrobiales bacterium]
MLRRTTRRQLLATAAMAAACGSLITAGRVAALEHGAGDISAHGIDPMVGVNPVTGTVFLSWVEPAATEDGHEATPATADHDMAMPASGTVMVARSTDGGKTFGRPVAASGEDVGVTTYPGGSPQVFAGPEGEVFVAYDLNLPHEGVPWGRDMLRLARSTDDGVTFEPAIDIFADPDVVEAGTYQDVFAAPDGTIYAAWLSYRQYVPENGVSEENAFTQVRVARSDDGGSSFLPSVLVDEMSCECCRASLAVGPDNTLYLAWRDQVPQTDGGDPVRNMVISRSQDRGETWSAAVPIHDDAWRFGQCPESGPVLGVDPGGTVHAAWFTGKEDGPGVYYAASTDGGATFSTPETLATDSYFPHANVRGFLDDEGIFWVTWDDSRTEEGAIQLVQIAPGGQVTTVPSEATSGRTPDVVRAGGEIVLTWLTDAGVQLEAMAAPEADA